jgi:hypothetical protein
MVDGVAVLLEVTADLNNPPIQLHQVLQVKNAKYNPEASSSIQNKIGAP